MTKGKQVWILHRAATVLNWKF